MAPDKSCSSLRPPQVHSPLLPASHASPIRPVGLNHWQEVGKLRRQLREEIERGRSHKLEEAQLEARRRLGPRGRGDGHGQAGGALRRPLRDL